MAKLTIILGKNAAKTANFKTYQPAQINGLVFYPEVVPALTANQPVFFAPAHPDDFVPQTVNRIRMLMIDGTDVELWTMNEYLVSAIALDVYEHPTYWNVRQTTFGLTSCVEVRLWEDDNDSFRRFGIDRDGMLCDIGDGGWPFGWFMPK